MLTNIKYNSKIVCLVRTSGTGNSSNILDYTFTDNTVQPGVAYCYRIKQVDMDGTFSYSFKTGYQMALENHSVISDFNVSAFPNPVTQNWEVKWDNTVRFDQIYNYDVTGKLVYNNSVSGNSSFIADLSFLDAGTYIYQLRGDEVMYEGKLLME